ncbi:phage tail fiber protein [Kosakonia sp. 1610]|uniref:phage tail fiber domain-containing protein n=1 Tax=Kosakonia sp. 1610 TaxID=3156426 RepID=UPI003D1ACFBB
MSVSSHQPYITYTANGATTVFPYDFYIITPNDLQISIDGVIVTTGYSVTGAGNQGGGNVTMLTPPAANSVVFIERVVPTSRLADYQDNGDLLADTVNKDFDRIWMAIQRAFIYLDLCLQRPLLGGPYNAVPYRIENLEDPINPQDAVNKRYTDLQGSNYFARSLRVPETQVNILPAAGARANRVFTFDKNGQPMIVAPYPGSAENVFIELAKDTGATLIGATPEGTVQAALDNRVKKTGDTMSGPLTIFGDGGAFAIHPLTANAQSYLYAFDSAGGMHWYVGSVTDNDNDLHLGNVHGGNAMTLAEAGGIAIAPKAGSGVAIGGSTVISGSLTATNSVIVGDGTPTTPAVLDESGDITGAVWNSGKLSNYIQTYVANQIQNEITNNPPGQSNPGSNGSLTIAGITLQWGRLDIGLGAAIGVTFPTPFPTACVNVQLTIFSTGGIGDWQVWVNGEPTNTGFTATDNSGSGTGTNVFWLAIGY